MLNNLLEIDHQLFIFLNNLGSESYDFLWILISNKICMFIFLLLLVSYLLLRYKQNRSIVFICAIIVCISLTDLLHVHLFKNVFMRLRPCWNLDIIEYMRPLLIDCGGKYGFISGHAANATALTTFILFSFKRHNFILNYILITWCLLVSYSRIYLGKHYPLDVFFGIVFGYLIGFGLFKLYNILYRKQL